MLAFTRRPFVLALVLAALVAALCFASPGSARQPKHAAALHRETVVITLNRRNEYFMDGKQVAKDRIKPLLAARVRSNPQTVAVIRIDRRQTSGRALALLDLVSQSKVKSVMIADPAKTTALRPVRPAR